jgi:hypothetical protein
MASFVALEMQSEENAAKNGEPEFSPPSQRSSAQVNFGQDLLSKNNVTTLQYPHNLLTWLKLIFLSSLH